jgi:hypothetical protein
MSDFEKGNVMKEENTVVIELTLQERDLIIDHTLANDDLLNPLESAIVEGNKMKFVYTLDDLDDLLGYIAAEANHTENKKLEKQLDALYDKLAKYEKT